MEGVATFLLLYSSVGQGGGRKVPFINFWIFSLFSHARFSSKSLLY